MTAITFKASFKWQGFLVRAYTIPDVEYHCLKEKLEEANTSLDRLLTQWERKYQDAFGQEEMIYNVHVFVSDNNV